MPDSTYTSPWIYSRGQYVRFAGQVTTVIDLTGETSRPRLALAAREPGGSIRICSPDEVEAVEPTLVAEAPPAEVVTVAELHEVARHLEANGAHDYAAVIRKAINQRGFDTIGIDRQLAAVTVTLDEVTAEATILAGHGPDVMVPARATGDRFLRVVGGQR